MKESTANPPSILFCPSTRSLPADLDHLNQNDLRKKARRWVDGANKLSKDALLAAVRKAMEDTVVAAGVLRSLDPEELAVATVYRRYGGSVNGEVIRLDLMARGLLQIIENRVSELLYVKAMEARPGQVSGGPVGPARGARSPGLFLFLYLRPRTGQVV